MTRRSLIQQALLIVGIDLAGLIGCVSRRPADWAAPPVRAVPDPTSELSRAEMEDLVAFGEALVEGRTLAPAERRYLVEHIEDRTKRSPGYLSLYQTTVSALDRLAGRRFSSLEIRERIQLIARYRLAGLRVSGEDDPGRSPAEMRTVRMRAVPDLIRGYYGSAAGWAVVGYQTFPGRCGDLTRYTRPES